MVFTPSLIIENLQPVFAAGGPQGVEAIFRLSLDSELDGVSGPNVKAWSPAAPKSALSKPVSEGVSFWSSAGTAA
jgi:hypothetical protein